jgi:hypothetical protein
VVGTSAHDTDAYPVALVPAGESIDNIDAVAGVEVVNSTLTVDAPDLEPCQHVCMKGHVIIFPKKSMGNVGQAETSPDAPRARMRASSGMGLALHDVSAVIFTSQSTPFYVLVWFARKKK